MRISVALGCASLVACGALAGCGASRTPEPTRPSPPPPLEARGEVCPGWERHETTGRTLFAMPGPATREERGPATAHVNAEGEVYLELVEEVALGLGDGGSDRAVIDGVLAGLGDPGAARLAAGWTVVAQGPTDFEGRPAAERVIDIQGQVIRRERIVRAGPTMIVLVTMVRRDREAQSAGIIRCFERSIVFAAPPSR